MIRRLLAAAFAAFVLLVAFQMRADGGLPGGAGGGGRPDGSAGDNGYEVFEDDEVELLCIEDLRSLCTDGLEIFGFAVRVEPAWTTVERLRDGGELGADAWLTIQPFPALAAPPPGTSPRPAALAAPTSVVARSPLFVTGPAAGVAAVDAACPDAALLLACLGGPGRPGPVVVHDPAGSAIGSLVLTSLSLELGVDSSTDLPSGLAPVEEMEAFLAGTRRSQAPLEDAVRIGGNAVAVTIEADLLEQVDRVDYDQRDTALALFGARYPLDVRAVEIVAVPTPGFGRPRDLQALLLTSAASFAFEREGWLPEGQRQHSLLDAPFFADRPAVRTDLAWEPELVREVRRVAAG